MALFHGKSTGFLLAADRRRGFRAGKTVKYSHYPERKDVVGGVVVRQRSYSSKDAKGC